MSQLPATNAPEPYIPPPSEAPKKDIRSLRPGDVFRWLAAGWRDVCAHPGIGAFYGGAFCLMAIVMGAVFRTKPEYTMTIASGCLLVGPFLEIGRAHV